MGNDINRYDNCNLEVRQMLTETSRGIVEQTISNAKIILEIDPHFQGKIKRNVMSEGIEVFDFDLWDKDSPAWTESDSNYLNMYMERYGIKNHKNIDKALNIVADNNKYHPIQNYLRQLKWDGVKRIDHALHHFLGAPDDELTAAATRLFMMGALARVFRPGCKFEYMLCLIGGQGSGKSTFFRFMAIKDEWFTDDLRRLDDEKVFYKLASHWIIEMPEMLATANAKSIEENKAFLSRQVDNHRKVYEKYAKDIPRQCVFGGTSNLQRFLPFDRTGNRRFLPIMTNIDNAEVHILADEIASREYINQMWAEAMTYFMAGDYSLTLGVEMEKAFAIHRLDFMAEDTLVGQIQAFLDKKAERDSCVTCSKEIYAAIHGVERVPAKHETNEICDILNTSIKDWEPGGYHVFELYGKQRCFKYMNNSNKSEFELVPEQMKLPFV